MKNHILERRSIRKFTKEEVTDSVIKEILYAATYAPSAHNKQPWEFVVVKNEGLKNKIGDCLFRFDERKGTISSSSKTAKIIKEVPVLLLVFNKYEDHPLFNTLSIGASIQNILLSAFDHGLGSIWMGNIVHVEEEVCKLAGRNMRLISAVGLGYADETPIPPDRNLVDKVVEWR